MNPNDADNPLRQAIVGLPLPQTPGTIVDKTRRLVRLRQLRRRALLTTSVVAVLLVGLRLWRPWNNSDEQNASALDPETLQALFAPPPVDPLNELDRRMAMALHVLDTQEKSQ